MTPRPELASFEPFEVALNPRLLQVGLLERAVDRYLAAPIELAVPRDAAEVIEHVYRAWERASTRRRPRKGGVRPRSPNFVKRMLINAGQWGES